jgi:hypothetical protein
VPIKKAGRKKRDLDDETRAQIIAIYKEQKLGARRLEKVLEYKHDKHIPHNAIHQVLLEERLAEENKKKKKRRKPWIRYERKHSLTLGVCREILGGQARWIPAGLCPPAQIHQKIEDRLYHV